MTPFCSRLHVWFSTIILDEIMQGVHIIRRVLLEVDTVLKTDFHERIAIEHEPPVLLCTHVLARHLL